MIEIKDQLGCILHIPEQPSIVSLVPSISKLIVDLGYENNLLGITKFCDEPVKKIVTIGGTKNPHLDKIIELQPDLILANKEENNQRDIDKLAEYFPCYVSDVKTLEDNYRMISDVGRILNLAEPTSTINSQISKGFDTLQIKEKKTVCYLIWNDPIMTIGNDTFINDVLARAGFKNVFSEKLRYPTITIDEIEKRQPDFIFLSSEPFPFTDKHLEYFKKNVSSSHPILVDGRAFSWYGSHMVKSVEYLRDFISIL